MAIADFVLRSGPRFGATVLVVCCTTATIGPAVAHADKKFPSISSVSPLQFRIGEQITIRGKNFLLGKFRTTVVFQRAGTKPILARAHVSTKTMLIVAVPPTFSMSLATKNGYPVYTGFRLRVLTRRLGQRPFAKAVSIGPAGSAETDTSACARVRLGKDGGEDLDGDFLTNAEEMGLVNRLDPCSKDTDGDTLEDGWEYYSAKDLNQRAIPYPGKRPFPNPLDPIEPATGSKPAYDFDGDGLTAVEEFLLWKTYGKPSQTLANRTDLLYSDGTKTSAGPGPNQNADLSKLQINANSCGTTVIPPNLGYLGAGYVNAGVPVEDDEKDADQDGLGNWMEASGTMTQAWWGGLFPEGTYSRRNFADAALIDSDTDGDGCLDGIDDQDNDDWPNWTESEGRYGTWADGASGQGTFSVTVPPAEPGGDPATLGPWTGWAIVGPAPAAVPYVIHPFNPCLPDMFSRTCSKYADTTYAPFTDGFRKAECRATITYRGSSVRTWVWDPFEEALAPKTKCPTP